jgi:hypothetical protein
MKSTSMHDDPRGFVCKLGDFGLSRVLDCNSTHVSTGTYGEIQYSPLPCAVSGCLAPTSFKPGRNDRPLVGWCVLMINGSLMFGRRCPAAYR